MTREALAELSQAQSNLKVTIGTLKLAERKKTRIPETL
jgi:hypothetical protein